jgi:hypothetical protein
MYVIARPEKRTGAKLRRPTAVKKAENKATGTGDVKKTK